MGSFEAGSYDRLCRLLHFCVVCLLGQSQQHEIICGWAHCQPVGFPVGRTVHTGVSLPIGDCTLGGLEIVTNVNADCICF